MKLSMTWQPIIITVGKSYDDDMKSQLISEENDDQMTCRPLEEEINR